MSRPRAPSEVVRALRQESGFGCAECGSPIIEYHHIIPWSELQHFDPDHMVALCPNHHSEFGKLSRSKSYAVKSNPHNIRTGRIKGYLGGNGNQKALRVGNFYIESCDTAIDFSGNTMFDYALVDGEFLLDAFIPDENFFAEVEVNRNNVTAFICEFWDIEFKTNWVKFRRTKGDIFLAIDFRGSEVEVEANLSVLGEKLQFRKSMTSIRNNSFDAIRAEHCDVGVRLGPPGRIIRPNYAMTTPRPILLSK